MGKKTIFHEVNILQCPICHLPFKMQNISMECDNGHWFKLENGYVNFLKEEYSPKEKELYLARRNIYFMGVFASFIDKMATLISHYCPQKVLTILDEGCSEGAFLCQLTDLLENEFDKRLLGVGFDMSQKAVETAASITKGTVWAVVDRNHIPVKDNVFDVVLSMFATLNYSEVKRLLKNEGILIKVFHGPRYFEEIASQEFLKAYYGDCGTEEEFREEFEVLEEVQVTYSEVISKRTVEELMEAGIVERNSLEEQERKREFLTKNGLTVDMKILVGKKK